MNLLCVNHNEEDVVYPLTTKGIVESQNRDPDLKLKMKREVIPFSWSKIQKDSVRMAKWSFQRIYNIEQ